MSFTIIGELINTTRTKVRTAVALRDVKALQKLVRLQEENGAGYIDVNTGTGVQTEHQDMQWLIKTVQAVATVPLCIDSPDPGVLESALDLVDRPPMVNSITLEKNRFGRMMDLLKGRDCQVVALCMDDTGMPQTADEICKRAEQLVNGLTGIGVRPEAIWIDPLVAPVSVETRNGSMALAAVAAIKKRLIGVKTLCGLSNISFGLPARRIINRTFLSLMVSRGLDGALFDPLDRELSAALHTTRMLMGQDDYCLEFMDRVAAGRILA
ncbi:MAG: dihydropteroate synthase [Proteobacteria bacterium]|nr:dihydropteroate synthase [Pseudomonadota bacterium]